MAHIFNKLLLFLYCLFTLLFQKADSSFIVILLFAFILACSNYFLEFKRYHLFTTSAYMLASCFIPSLLCFLPLVFYDVFQHRLLFPAVTGLASYLLGIKFMSSVLIFYLLLGVAIAYMTQHLSCSCDILHLKYKQTRDDSTELNFLLKQKNKTLLEKQDYDIYTATLRERNRIAREIHDNVGHLLSRSILMVGALKTTQKEETVKTSLSQLEDSLSIAMDSVRKSVHDLHDDSVNLEASINSIVDTFEFCAIHLEYDIALDVPREIKYSFIAIVKEALSNIMKHSNATSVHLAIREHPGLYQLIVADNGTCIAMNEHSGIGLLNIENRIEALSGHTQFETEQGFRIFITVPKNITSISEVS